ncbi:MAG: LptF/LptG family permease [Alphaproteobacteria bacterium]
MENISLMSLLFKYLFKKFILATFVINAFCILIIWMSQSLRFLEFIVHYNLSFSNYLSFVIYLIPDIIAMTIPIILTFSGIYVFNRLKGDHELRVLCTSGMSSFNIALPFLCLGIMTSCLIYYMNISIIPKSFQMFRQKENFIRNKLPLLSIREGHFHFINGTTFYVQERTLDGHLKGILVHKPKLSKTTDTIAYTIVAQSGILQKTKNSYAILLKNGYRQEIDTARNKMDTLQFEELFYDFSKILPKTRESRTIKAFEKSLRELFYFDLQDDPLMAAKMRVELHQKLITPLIALMNTLLVCAFMLTGSLERRNNWKKIISCLSTSFLFHIITIIMIHISGHYQWMIYCPYITLGIIIISCLICLLWHPLNSFLKKTPCYTT